MIGSLYIGYAVLYFLDTRKTGSEFSMWQGQNCGLLKICLIILLFAWTFLYLSALIWQTLGCSTYYLTCTNLHETFLNFEWIDVERKNGHLSKPVFHWTQNCTVKRHFPLTKIAMFDVYAIKGVRYDSIYWPCRKKQKVFDTTMTLV